MGKNKAYEKSGQKFSHVSSEPSYEEEEPETNNEMKVNKMKNYFKKSNVYKTYLKEQDDELKENKKIVETQKEIQDVKQKMIQLMGNYEALQNKVRQ